jgi:molybdopterin molybdotransferase
MTPGPEQAASGGRVRPTAPSAPGRAPVTDLVPLVEARRFVLQLCHALGSIEVPIDDALGHVTARAVVARSAVPPFATSAMDGYALRSADTAGGPVVLRVVGALMAGDEPRITVGSGEAVRIMTGAAVPSGADAVCVIERCVVHDGGATVEVDEFLSVDKHIRHVGGDIEPGDEVIGTAATLGSGHLGVLASLGIETVVVHARPRVGVLSTGDELVDGAAPLRPGMIPDANRHMLLAQIRQSGWPAIDLGIVGDDKVAVAAALRDGAARCDALVTSGGVSVGDLDVVKLVLDDLSGGTMRWMQVAIKPAKPLAFGHLAATGTPVFGLPGNPVSAMVSFELFARPALRRMAGHLQVERPRLKARATADLHRKPDGKVHFILAKLTRAGDGGLEVSAGGGQQSHQLRALADTNALAVLPDGEGVKAGEAVEIMLLEAELLGLARGDLVETGGKDLAP